MKEVEAVKKLEDKFLEWFADDKILSVESVNGKVAAVVDYQLLAIKVINFLRPNNID